MGTAPPNYHGCQRLIWLPSGSTIAKLCRAFVDICILYIPGTKQLPPLSTENAAPWAALVPPTHPLPRFFLFCLPGSGRQCRQLTDLQRQEMRAQSCVAYLLRVGADGLSL